MNIGHRRAVGIPSAQRDRGTDRRQVADLTIVPLLRWSTPILLRSKTTLLDSNMLSGFISEGIIAAYKSNLKYLFMLYMFTY